jgi:hypothetical protein
MSRALPPVAEGPVGRALAVLERIVISGLVGAGCGLFFGLTVGLIHAPADVPGDPPANEWYTAAGFAVMFIECVAGFLLGFGVAVGFRTSPGRRRAFALAFFGSALGAGLAWVLARVFHVMLVDWRDGSELVSSLISQAVGAVGGMALAAPWRVASVTPALNGPPDGTADA